RRSRRHRKWQFVGRAGRSSSIVVQSSDTPVKGKSVSDFETVDYFVDPSLVPDPYEYFEYLRSVGPVVALPSRGVVAVTGLDEALAVYRDPDTFSSCNAVAGPFPRRAFESNGDDVSELIEQFRPSMPMGEYLIAQDPPVHAAQRGL